MAYCTPAELGDGFEDLWQPLELGAAPSGAWIATGRFQ